MLIRFLRLAPHRRRLLLRALGWVALLRLLLPALRFSALYRWLSPGRGSANGTIELADARWAVMAAARRIPGARCLARSLALQALLRGSALQTEFRIGIAKHPDGSLAAHAWITCDGHPVLPDEDLSSYTLLPLRPG
jgi:Transglutaminase-like superfamily